MALTLDGTAGITFPVTAGSASAVQASSGRVLQVVSSKSSTTVTSTGNADLIAVSITPTSATSKILVIASFTCAITAGTNAYMIAYIYRGTNTGTLAYSGYSGYGLPNSIGFAWSATVLDSPSTTSSQTYTFVCGKGSGSTTSWTTDGQPYTLTLMEIAA